MMRRDFGYYLNLSWNGLTRDLVQGFFLGVELFRTAASCERMLGVGTYS